MRINHFCLTFRLDTRLLSNMKVMIRLPAGITVMKFKQLFEVIL